MNASRIATAIMAVIALVAAGAMAVAVNVVLVKVCAPLLAMTGAMRRLAEGDHGIDVPAVGRKDELGHMAGAVQVFKENAIAKLRADTEIAEAKARSEAERQAAAAKAIAEQQQLVVQSFGVGLDRLAHGDLTYRVEDDLPVEYEKLRADFNGAVAKLQSAMKVIIGNADGIRAGSREITNASDGMARRMEQQAASLEETAAALDEITATVRQTAASAVQANGVVDQVRAEADGDVLMVSSGGPISFNSASVRMPANCDGRSRRGTRPKVS